jgi:hypothetical protein
VIIRVRKDTERDTRENVTYLRYQILVSRYKNYGTFHDFKSPAKTFSGRAAATVFSGLQPIFNGL